MSENPSQQPNVPAYKPCKHCGSPFSTRGKADAEFCCNGCQYVYSLINSEGLEHYYQLREDKIDPVNPSALQKRDLSWLETAAAEASANSSRNASAIFDLEGISCIGCVWLIEKIFRKLPGSQRIEINTQYGQIKIVWSPGIFPMVDFARQIQQFGYLLGPPGERPQLESKRLVNRIGISAACALNAMLFTLPRYLGMESTFFLADLFELLTMLFTTISLLTCGSYFIKRGFQGLIHKVIHIDLPISLGIVFAYAGSVLGWFLEESRFLYFDFVAIFIFLMLVGRWLQERALETNRHRLLSRNKAPSNVQTVDDTLAPGPTISLANLTKGMRFRVSPGEVIPVLSELENLQAGLSLEWINGESDMQSFTKGQLVPAGGQNIGLEPILLVAYQDYHDSTLRRLLESSDVNTADPKVERFLKVYLLIVIFTAIAGASYWAALIGDQLTALQVALSVLVVSCPCALGVALPFAQELAVIRLRKIGLFIRQQSIFNRLKRIKRIIFDKTGTLTLEAPSLINPDELNCMENDPLQERDRAVLRAMVESSMHPVSRALRDALLAFPSHNEPHPPADLIIREEIGRGLLASSESLHLTWKLGKASWASSSSTDAEKGTLFSANNKVCCQFKFEDTLRENAFVIISQLQKLFSIVILSGDQKAKVHTMAKTLGIPAENALGEQSPQEKLDFINRFPPDETLFIGDGANDALAFRSAAVRGTPATPHGLLNEDADFFFTGRTLKGILSLFHVQQTHQRTSRAVLVFTILYNLMVVIISLLGHMHPLMAAILMPLSSIATLLIVSGMYQLSD